MAGKTVKQGVLGGLEYVGFVSPIGGQFMASIVSVAESFREHVTKLCATEKEAEAEILSAWSELEQKLK